MIFFVLLLVDCLLLVVFYLLIDGLVCSKQCYTYIRIIFFLVILQENIDTVKVEGFENVGEEDCTKMKTEENYMQLVRTVKSEDEVSIVCWCVFW